MSSRPPAQPNERLIVERGLIQARVRLCPSVAAVSVAMPALPLSASVMVAVIVVVAAMVLAHPALLYEVDGLPAGAVAAAMPAPVVLVVGRHVEIDGTLIHGNRSGRDHYRLRVHNSWLREVADVDSTIDTGLVNTDRYPDVGLGPTRRNSDNSKRK